MKNIILSVVALFICTVSLSAGEIGSLEELDRGQTYLISVSGKGFFYADSNKAMTKSTSDGDASRWIVYHLETTGATYIYNVGAGLFLTANGSACVLQEAATDVALLATSTPGQWQAYSNDCLMGVGSISGTSPIYFSDNISSALTFSFTEAGAASDEMVNSVRLKALEAENAKTEVKVIQTIGNKITALSGLQEGTTVLLYSQGFSKYAYVSGGTLTLNATAPSANNLTGMNYVFTLHKNGDDYTFETGSGKWISGVDGGNVYVGETPDVFKITASETSGCFNIYSTANGQYINAQSGKPVGWGQAEGNSRYAFTEVTLTNSEKYYPFTYDCYETDGEHTRSLGVQTYTNANNRLSVPTFTGYRRLEVIYDGKTIAATATMRQAAVVTVLYERTLRTQPFKTTSIAGTAFADTTHWYRMKVNGYYLEYDAAAKNHYTLNSKTVNPVEDRALWCFVGNNVEGYRIYNRVAGTAQSLSLDDAPADGDVPFIYDGASKYWGVSNGASSTTYYLSPVGYDVAYNLQDDTQGKLSIFEKTGAQAGVSFEHAADAMQTFAAEVEAKTGEYAGMYVANAQTENLKQAAAAYAGTNATFNRLQQAYNDYMENASVVNLEENRFYRIVNVAQSDKALGAAIDAAKVSAVTASAADKDQYWMIFPLGSTGQYGLISPNSGSRLVTTRSGQETTLSTTDGTHFYKINSTAAGEFTLQDAGTSGTSNYVCLNNSAGTVTGATLATEGNRWSFVPVNDFEVNISSSAEKPYTTLCLPFTYRVPEGVSVLAVNAIDENGANVADLTNHVVAAGTPVVLYSENLKTFNVTYTDETPGEAVENMLLGNVVRSSAEAGSAFVLGNDGASFVKLTETTLPAFSAYLDKSVSDASSLNLFIPTGIGQVEIGTSGNAAIFDLQGRRVLQPQRGGIYIRSGKKVIF